MSSPLAPPISAARPPTAELAAWLLTQGTHCIIGAAIGSAAARAMRRTRLHWSWALGTFALVLLARNALSGGFLPAALASAWAAKAGRCWHREELESGGDLAARARLRRSPVDALQTLARRSRERLPGRFEIRRPRSRAALPIGRDERGRTVSVPFAPAGGSHALVVGATGSGKTVTQAWIAVRAIEQGAGAIVVDPKGDGGLRDQLQRAARAAGRELREWSPHGPCVYNPYARGSDSEVADKVLAGERFTEPHYLRQAQRYLGHVVRGLRAAGCELSLRTIVDHLSPDQLELLIRTLPEAAAAGTHDYLDSLTARQRSELGGVRDRLAILAESDVGRWLDPAASAAPRIELLQAVHGGAVVYFSLEADSRPLLTQMLGAAIVQDLLTAVAALQGHPVPTVVVIDEFSAVAAEQVVRLFGRARSAGFSLLLGTQELSDLRPPGRERLLEQVMGNLSLLVAHRQVVPSSAELISGVAGTRGAWKVTRHSDGRTTRTRVRERVVEPERVMALTQGWAVVVALAGGGGSRVARVFSPAERAPGGRAR